MDFTPPIASRSKEELLKIASDWEAWQPEARALALAELERRRVPAEEVEQRKQDYSNAYVAEEELRDRHSQQSETLPRMFLTFIGAPLLLATRVGLNHFGFKLGLSELDRRNFKKKYRQRMAMLIAGTLFWIVVVKSLG